MVQEDKPRILLVDDNATNLQVLHGALEGLECTLLAARSGEQALKIANKAHPALILLDVMMPGLDGYETCVRLKADEVTRDTIVIFLTALQETEAKVYGLSLGAVDFITKPFDTDEVIARVRRQLEIYSENQRLAIENRGLSEQVATLQKNAPETPEQRAQWVTGLINSGESGRVEFKSTLRWNLKRNCTDKAIEVAWLKTVVAFLNTEGGILIIGVEDDGNVLGTKADQFANEDKLLLHVNNLIKQCIGLEYVAYIRFDLVPVGGVSILVIESRPSPTPVFLRIGNAEDFYVRVGPGSRKLSTSEVLAYVSGRG